MAFINRRRFLMNATGFAATVPFLSSMTSTAAQAQSGGYKALVCVMLLGGVDGTEMIMPIDTASHNLLRTHRETLFKQYGGRNDPANLLDLNVDLEGRRVGLIPEMSELHRLYQTGEAAVVANIGPLIEPTDRTSYYALGSRKPSKLFSHNDQQSTWLSGGPEGTSTGWGGRFLDSHFARSPGDNPVFSALATGDAHSFLTGQRTRYLGMPIGAPVLYKANKDKWRLGSGRNSAELQEIITRHHRTTGYEASNLFESDLHSISRSAIDNLNTYNDVVFASDPFAGMFPETSIGKQLGQVARTIYASQNLGASRQIFYVKVGGFDTHGDQAGQLSGLMKSVSDAIGAFSNAMKASGKNDEVTLFTASDFGRTVVANSDGTDHGWAGHQFVSGGAVAGGRMIGQVRSYDLSDPYYLKSRGRLIPTIAVDQLAYTLGSWFGINETDLATALPNLANFAHKSLPLFRT